MNVYTVEELAGILRCSSATIYRHRSEWPHMMIGAKVLFTDEHLAQIIALQTKTPEPKEKTRPRVGTRAARNTK